MMMIFIPREDRSLDPGESPARAGYKSETIFAIFTRSVTRETKARVAIHIGLERAEPFASRVDGLPCRGQELI